MQDKFIKVSYRHENKTVERYFATLTHACNVINELYGDNTVHYQTVRLNLAKRSDRTFKVNTGFSFANIIIERMPNKKK